MPDKRLQKCRAAYVESNEPLMSWPELQAYARHWRSFRIGETVPVPLPKRHSSAAYRITQAQKAHDDGT